MKNKFRLLALLLATVIALTALVMPGVAGAAAPETLSTDPEPTGTVRLWVPSRDLLATLNSSGYDLAGGLVAYSDGYEVDAVVTAAELEALRLLGVQVVEFLSEETLGYAGPFYVPSQDVPPVHFAPQGILVADPDTVTLGRIDYFTTSGQGFISVEAKTSSSTAGLTLRWDAGPGTEIGEGGSASMSKFTDAGVYMYHRAQIPVSTRPTRVEVVSNEGGQAIGEVQDWLRDIEPMTARPGYQHGFVNEYMNPTQAYARIEQLAAEFPNLAEIVPLPNLTNGYRRKAQAQIGSSNASRVVVSSKAWGHEGGNDLTIQFVHPDTPNATLGVDIDGNAITVRLATNADNQITSRAIDVVNALNAEAGDLVEAFTYRGNAGTGTVAATEVIQFTDFLEAPDSISRNPFQVRALRIGKVRDGSKLGVMAFAQEHAREWVPVLVALETAERLLRNYETDPDTKKLVDNLDIFIVPSSNPDGGHYSFFNYASQRRNMTNYCGPENSDPGRRNAWGVDINRNYGVGTIWEGYDGASLSCTSDTFAGPEPLSEPESRNIVWLAETFPNIKFSMSIHSHGGYLLWAPGVYKRQGRVALPSPTLGQESFYWHMADHILSNVKAHRGIAVLPQQTGAAIDVLYSAAGASDDHMWYDLGIWSFTFEVGTAIWNPSTRRFQSVGFQPAFAEGYQEAQEYASGLIALYEIAYEYANDKSAEATQLVLASDGSVIDGERFVTGPVEVRFETNEPADIYYTTDGSRPTLESTRYAMGAVREQGMKLPVSETTVFKWFSVDAAGNIENGYDPNGDGDGYNEASIVIVSAPELTVTEPSTGLITNKWSVKVSGTAVDESGPVTVTINGEEVDVEAGGSFTHHHLLEHEGDNDIIVTATNQYGLATSVNLTVHVDVTAPELTIVAPLADVSIEQGESVTFAFDSEPGLAAAYDVVLTGQTDLLSVPGVAMNETSPGHYEATFTAPSDALFADAEVWFYAADAAGNMTQVQAPGTLTVTPFVAPPEVTITSPAPDTKTGSDVITVSGTASDATGIVSVTVNGRKASVDGDGNFSTRIILSEGENVVTVVATAGSGKQTTATVTVTAVWSPPTLSDLVPAEDIELVAGESYVFRFTAAPGLTAAYQVVLGGSPGTVIGKGTPKGTAMTEVSPGVYEATYTAPANTNFSNAVIRFNVADDVGNLIMLTAPGRLTVKAAATAAR